MPCLSARPERGRTCTSKPFGIAIAKPVAAHKVIRSKAEHTVRVGEDERSAAEMTALLNQTEEKKSYWWIYAAAIALIAVIFIGWYLSEHGLDVSAISNTSPLKTE